MKTVIITGVSQGLGKVMAGAFAAAGWKVFGTGRSERPAGLDEVITYARFDASDAVACEAFWSDFAANNADADSQICLVNNAGGYVGGGLKDGPAEDYQKMLQSIYLSSVYMTKGLAAHYDTARIINIISSSALEPEAVDLAYGAAKTAQLHFFQSLQKAFKADTYRITNIYPSYIASSGPNPKAIDPADLAALVLEQAESTASYYMRDVTLDPTGR